MSGRDDRELAAEWAVGFRDGYAAGYSQGLDSGRRQAWDRAAWEVWTALEGAAEEVRERVQHFFAPSPLPEREPDERAGTGDQEEVPPQ